MNVLDQLLEFCSNKDVSDEDMQLKLCEILKIKFDKIKVKAFYQCFINIWISDRETFINLRNNLPSEKVLGTETYKYFDYRCFTVYYQRKL